jgi:5-formyltetrahydrofolate cyclo-ligase
VSDAITIAKSEARKAAALKRNAAVSPDWAAGSFAGHVFPVAISSVCKSVSGFYPYQSEADIRPLLGRLAGQGWTTALPVVLGKNLPLIFRRWLPGEPTVAGKWNIQVPPESAPLVEPDVLLVPMLAFDRAGYRLGYGGGFYDRTLEELRRKKPIVAIGIAYALQEIKDVPHDALDQKLDYVFTEREVIKCA